MVITHRLVLHYTALITSLDPHVISKCQYNAVQVVTTGVRIKSIFSAYK